MIGKSPAISLRRGWVGVEVKPTGRSCAVGLLGACDSGASVREVAERLMVNPSYVVKVHRRRDETGETAARRGTGRPALKIAPHLELLRERVTAQPNATLGELQGWLLAECGVAVSPVTVWRALARLGRR